MRLQIRQPKVQKLWLTPIIDMLLTIMIFLLISFAPEEARLKKSDQTKLPVSAQNFTIAESIRLEVSDQWMKVEGRFVDGLRPTDAASPSWALLSERLSDVSSQGKKQIVVMADQDLSYQVIDSTLAHLAKSGFSDVYLLTRKSLDQ